jgi:uncharacterized membrane protein YoaK (UPF0700 family)
VLSLIAGSADAISLLGYGLFTAHITGNLAVLAVRTVTDQRISLALLLSLPVFIVVIVATRLISDVLSAAGRQLLRPLLLWQFLLFDGFLLTSVVAHPRVDPHAAVATVGVLLGVAALAVQNALVQLSLPGVPATTVQTINLTRLSIDGVALLWRDRPDAAQARERAGRTWPVFAGFTVGAGVGAAGFATWGTRSVAIPTALALLALLISGTDRR